MAPKKRVIKKTRDFFHKDLWKIPLKKLSPHRSFLIRQLRIFMLALKGFVEDKIQLRASALTFYSLLAVVPVLAMGFAIAKGFGYEEKLKVQILENFSEQEVVLNQMIGFAENLLDNTKGGYLAGVGAIILFWSVMKVLGHIENSLNDIWQIKQSRSFFRKFSDYISLMIVAPIIIIFSSSINVFITTQVESLSETIPIFGYLSKFVFLLVKAIPYVLIWGLFTLVYVIMPNTKVNFKYGMIAGIIAGTMFQLLQWGYVTFQVGVSRYNAIYGSFAALPLFLIWLEISWFIVLLGAEISFAYQNIENYEHESGALNVSTYYKRILSLLIVYHIIKNFEKGEKPYTSSELAHKLEMPIRLVNDILFELKQSNIINETTTLSPKEMAYQPALDINKISVTYIFEKLDKRGEDDIDVMETSELKKLSEIQQEIYQNIQQTTGPMLIKDIKV